MQTIILYKYTRPDGGVTTSPIMPQGEYITSYRLVADEGMALTNDNENFTACVDVDETTGWIEVEDPNPDPEPDIEI